MGFKLQATTFNVGFPEGDPLHGLEMKIRSLSMGKFLELSRMQAGVSAQDDFSTLERICDDVISKIASWNMEDENGQPIQVPTTGRGLLDLFEPIVLNNVIDAYLRASVQVPVPLEKVSSSGETFQGQLPPTVPL